ncbi:hypothetical protein AVEN_168800-1 [Araneus ventricosus]|uniref:Uncharacterized protein n=1 Tax=Araneus ventricosus TaxID=182803 RepID=A0A4Y2K992_ARAVE|nr:hypothetical protein AVEN_168800-1 [Araneus ventricosus]
MLRDGLEISFWKSSFRDPCVAVLAGGKRRRAGGLFDLWALCVSAMFAYVGGRGLWRMRPHHAWMFCSLEAQGCSGRLDACLCCVLVDFSALV